MEKGVGPPDAQRGGSKGRGQWVLDGIGGTLTQKQPPKESKPKTMDKTQKIRKEKKGQRKGSSKGDSGEGSDWDSFQQQLIQSAIHKLSLHLRELQGQEEDIGELQWGELMDFLQKVEGNYDFIQQAYRLRGQSLGEGKRMLMKFVNSLTGKFPLLKQLLLPIENRYHSKTAFRTRYDSLLQRNITPVLRIMSEELNADSSLELSNEILTEQMKEQFFKEMAELDDQPSKKKKKRKNKQKKKEGVAEQEEEEGDMSELMQRLQEMEIQEEERVECRVNEEHLSRWALRDRGLRGRKG